MNARQCYCNSISREALAEQGIAAGFCGICEVCQQPGHTRHYPGAVPYTGAWCDACFAQLGKTAKTRKMVGFLFYLLFILLIVATVAYQVYALAF